jgi:hypothetical protein
MFLSAAYVEDRWDSSVVGRTVTLMAETVETTIMHGMGNIKTLTEMFTRNFTKSYISIKSKMRCLTPYLTKYVILQHHNGNSWFSETSHNISNAGLCVT